MQRYVNHEAAEKAALAMIERIVARGRAEMARGEFTHVGSPEEAQALKLRVTERVKRNSV
jgi:hypothetical protein